MTTGSRGARERLTRDNVAGIHGVLVFDETKAVHQLDFGDLAGTMGGEVGFDIGLGSFGGASVRVGPNRGTGRVKGGWPRRIHWTGAHQDTYHSGASCPSRDGWMKPRP
jgi:hypothetical protein